MTSELTADATRPGPRSARLIIMGPQGAGKGTQAARLAEHYGVPAISTGDIFRANIKGGTELGKLVQEYTAKGDLVPDSVTNDMVRDRLAQDDVAHGFIPGIRAGRPTAEYLDYVITRITSAGAIYLALVALIPTLVLVLLGVSTNIPFGGSSILIVVGVGLETVKQIDSQLQQRHYEGFLR